MNFIVCLCSLSYLDPGAGSLLIQALVGGAAGLLVAVRHIWRTFRAGQRADSAGTN
ncbi:hypothetical protein LBMAG46_43400 [Planctomycetia bacterium]|nr:hypothetical protein LBMAG46_43400 [Planctomycetia bacterium]